MLVIGLTGGIGMGKSAAAEHFARRGVPVFNADACVHRLYEGEAVGPIEAAFPGVTRGGKVDRKLLSEKLAGSQARLKQLEAIVHPHGGRGRDRFPDRAGRRGREARRAGDPAFVRDRRRAACRRDDRADRARACAEGARAGAAGHDGGQARASARAPARRRRATGARRLRCGQRHEPRRHARSAR